MFSSNCYVVSLSCVLFDRPLITQQLWLITHCLTWLIVASNVTTLLLGFHSYSPALAGSLTIENKNTFVVKCTRSLRFTCKQQAIHRRRILRESIHNALCENEFQRSGMKMKNEEGEISALLALTHPHSWNVSQIMMMNKFSWI